MSIRDNFFADKAVGALWDVAVSLKRGNPLPLDSNSVFESIAALEAYLNDKSTVAYPGQVVAVVGKDGETEFTKIYYIDHTLAYHEVGKEVDLTNYATKEDLANAIAEATPAVDNSSIEIIKLKEGKVAEDGDEALALHGFYTADDGLLAQIKVNADGTRELHWVSIETIAEGDGNTTYAFTGSDASEVFFKVKASDAAEAVTIYLDTYSKEEIDAKFAALADADTTYAFAGVTPELENITPYFTVTPKDSAAEKVYIDTYTTAELDERDEYLKGLITQALIFKGVVAEENFNKEAGTIKVGEEWVNAEAGWVIVVNEADGTGKEYVFDGTKWELLGDAGDLATKSELEAAIKGIVIPEPDGNTEYEFTEQADNSNVYFTVKSNEEGAEDELVHLDAYTRQETEDKIAEAIGELVIPEPDGNDNTEYALSLGDDGLTVILKTTEGVDAGSAKIDAYTKSEIDGKLAIIGEDDEISENFTIINAIRGLEQSLGETDEKVETLEDKVKTLEETKVQADWAQHDESAPDYIKNRTHYYYETVEDEIISAEQVFSDVELLGSTEDYQVTVNGEVCDWTIRVEMPQRIWTATNGENTYTMTWATGAVASGYTLVPADAAWEFRAKSVDVKKLDKVYLPTDVVYTDALTDAIAKVEAKIPTEVGEDNIIEIIKVNGTALEVGADKSVDITIDLPGLATDDVAGLVKTSSEVNGVSLNDNGQMEVNSINVNKLVQTDYIILNGGNAALDQFSNNN